MKKFLIQIGILLLVYYFIPDIIRDFLSDTTGKVVFYIPVIIQAAVAVIIIYSLFNFKVRLEQYLSDFIKTNFKLKLSEELLIKFVNLIVLLVYVIIIASITIPVLRIFIGQKLITVIKLIVVGYCVFIGWSGYKLFDDGEPTKKHFEESESKKDTNSNNDGKEI